MSRGGAPRDEALAAARNRAWREVQAIDGALAAGRIDEPAWYEAMQRLVTPAYLAGENPRAQSGHSGDEKRWREARSIVCDALDGDGSFLDVGCANGHLMESVAGWARERGLAVEPFGVDIAPELVALARSRLPAWRERIWEGNALHWRPPRRFTYVRTGLEYVPAARRIELVSHLLDGAVDHRLIIGPANEEVERSEILDTLAEGGVEPAGVVERPHDHPGVVRRLAWVEKNRGQAPSRGP